jgi:hypothetical protein
MKYNLVFENLEVEFVANENHASPGYYGAGIGMQLVTVTVPLDDEGVPNWEGSSSELVGRATAFYQDVEGEDMEIVLEPTEKEEERIKRRAYELTEELYYEHPDGAWYKLQEVSNG